jgi:hypothetical protein
MENEIRGCILNSTFPVERYRGLILNQDHVLLLNVNKVKGHFKLHPFYGSSLSNHSDCPVYNAICLM